MSKVVRRALQAFALIAALVAINASAASAAEDEGRYIVVFNESVEHPGDLAHEQVDATDGDMTGYFSLLDGYAATLPRDEVANLRDDPGVDYITIDHQVSVLEEEVKDDTKNDGGIEVSEATLPTGIQRSYASANKALDIDGVDDLRADVDVAVIDTGIDFEHADLNVVARTSCITGTCIDNTGTDVYTHGTHVAGTIGAIDNGIGVVGVAPGARMWAVKSLGDGGSGQESWIIKGVEWVTAHAKEIEVANMSLGCECPLKGLEEAIEKSIKAGVVYTIAAGNSSSNAEFFSPAKLKPAITVSAVADYDGKPGAKSAFTCANYGLDDRLASFSNYGPVIDVAAPGVCTLSTLPGNKYGLKSGTSMAAPHVAGAAAVLAIQKNPESQADVEAIRNTIVAAGNSEWTDTSPDGVKEPLLDLSNESTFKLVKPSPENTALPVASPTTPLQAVPETTTTGTWTNEPTSYAYQWQRCNAVGGECVNIAGATKSTYTPVGEDVGKTLVAKVTAKNAGGETSATSEATNKVKPIGEITEFALPKESYPWGIAPGPDGKLWYADYGSNKVGKITTGGTITEYALPKESKPRGVTAGPDGNLWFTDWFSNHIGKITLSGTVTEYLLPVGSHPSGIATGPDGNLWFTNSNSGKIGKKPTTGAITEYKPAGGVGEYIVAGPDGNLWYTGSGHIGKITTSGTATEYGLPEGSWAYGITSGPDGNLWFSEYGSSKIGKITTGGTITEYALPKSSGPTGIATGPDGNLWFTTWLSGKIGRITTGGTITEYALPLGSHPEGIVAGPDSNMWYTAYGTSKIGKITP